MKPTRSQVEAVAREMFKAIKEHRRKKGQPTGFTYSMLNPTNQADYRAAARWHLARVAESRSADEVIIRALHVELANRRKSPAPKAKKGRAEK